jgi:hypothetical protein
MAESFTARMAMPAIRPARPAGEAAITCWISTVSPSAESLTAMPTAPGLVEVLIRAQMRGAAMLSK